MNQCVLDALDVGYRLIDTAQAYYNEEAVGRALQKTSVPREEIFLTTKVWVTEFGYEKAKASVLESMRKLQVDYLDLVLIHQCLSDYYGAYHALEDLYAEGKIRAIGISNFSAERMADIATFNQGGACCQSSRKHICFGISTSSMNGWKNTIFRTRHGARLAQHRISEWSSITRF